MEASDAELLATAPGHVGSQKEEHTSGAHDQATAARRERLDDLQRRNDTTTVDSDEELDALVQMELDSDDELDALVAAELDATTEPELEPEPEPEAEASECDWPCTTEEMDQQLETCFLQAARTRLHKKKSLPLDAAVVYAGHMRKVRRAGTDLVSIYHPVYTYLI